MKYASLVAVGVFLWVSAAVEGADTDPEVAYREALFEEVDAGNLEKAVELYSRILEEAGTSKPLKAKALVRRGYCLEKLGRRDEAEQIYRDVLERFPSEERATKLARARLTALDHKETGVPSLEAEIQQLVLDLGSKEREVREKAVDRLALIGGAAYPELRRATEHKNSALSVGAARVLVRLEQFEGLYDVFRRAAAKVDLGSYDMDDLRTLLRARMEDRERFIEEFLKTPFEDLGSLFHIASDLKDDRLQSNMEDQIVAEEWAQTLIKEWKEGSDPDQAARLIGRLTAVENPQYNKLIEFVLPILQRFEWEGRTREELQPIERALVMGLKNLSDPELMRAFSSTIAHPFREDDREDDRYEVSKLRLREWRRFRRGDRQVWQCTGQHSLDVAGKSFFQDLYANWLRSDAPEIRSKVAGMAEYLEQCAVLDVELGKFLFSAIGSPEYSDDLKRTFFELVAGRYASPEQEEMVSRYCLGYLKGLEEGAEPDGGMVKSCVYHLTGHLSADAPELDMVLDAALRHWPSPNFDELLESEDAKPWGHRFAKAAVRNLRTEDHSVQLRALLTVSYFGGIDGELRLAELLPSLADEGVRLQASRILGKAIAEAEPTQRAPALQAALPLFASSDREVRSELFYSVRGLWDETINDLMAKAVTDSDLEIRAAAIGHWSKVKRPEGLPYLIKALQDPDDGNKVRAIQALGDQPSVDSVPHLMPFLRSPNDALLSAAFASLGKIKDHYDMELEWRSWYEEVKGKLGD